MSKISWDTAKKLLVDIAMKARRNAYAPYSKFYVGAAVIAEHPASGWLGFFSGCNIENASYGLTICAERAAIFNAISNNYTIIHGLACCAEQSEGVIGTSCGACRQVMNEFNPDMSVFYADANGTVYMETTVKELLPRAFSLGNTLKVNPTDSEITPNPIFEVEQNSELNSDKKVRLRS